MRDVPKYNFVHVAYMSIYMAFEMLDIVKANVFLCLYVPYVNLCDKKYLHHSEDFWPSVKRC